MAKKLVLFQLGLRPVPRGVSTDIYYQVRATAEQPSRQLERTLLSAPISRSESESGLSPEEGAEVTLSHQGTRPCCQQVAPGGWVRRGGFTPLGDPALSFKALVIFKW